MADFSMAMVRKLIKDKHPDISEGELKYETIRMVYADCYNEEEFARIRAHFVGSNSVAPIQHFCSSFPSFGLSQGNRI